MVKLNLLSSVVLIATNVWTMITVLQRKPTTQTPGQDSTIFVDNSKITKKKKKKQDRLKKNKLKERKKTKLLTSWWASLMAFVFGNKVVFVSKAASVIESFAASSLWIKSPSGHIRLTRSWVSRLSTDVHWEKGLQINCHNIYNIYSPWVDCERTVEGILWALFFREGLTHVQDCTQVLFHKYFIFDRVICHFHITSYVTVLCVLWWIFIDENNLRCLSWGSVPTPLPLRAILNITPNTNIVW